MKTGAAFRFVRSAALAAGLALPLAGCETFDLTNLIPDSKKKLPGERREVFPGGVPGVSQGVPQELVKGYQAPPETAAVAPPELAEQPAPAPEPKKEAAKPKPKPRAKPTPTVAPEYQQSGQTQGQWPGQQAAPQAAWPAPPKPGTFAR